MSLKLNITAEEHAALDDAVKSLYEADGDNFKLAVEGIEDTGALRRAKEREAQLAREEKKRADELQARIDEIEAREADADKDSKRKKGDIEALEKSWKETADKREKAALDKVEAMKGQMQKLLVGNVAQSIASELFTVPEAMVDFVSKRLKAEFDGDTPTTRILDNEGHPSAATIEDFKKELLANEKLKGILVASKSSGGGAGNGGGSGSGGSTKKLADMDDNERVELYRTNPDRFNQLLEQQRNN